MRGVVSVCGDSTYVSAMGEGRGQEIGVLKSIWRKNDAARWVIHDAKGIDLKPREGVSNDYFKLKDELVLLPQRPGPVFENIFSSSGRILLRRSIMAVAAWNDGDDEMRLVGKGFFISATGYLLTAAHDLTAKIELSP
jgi:hypothetical protein